MTPTEYAAMAGAVAIDRIRIIVALHAEGEWEAMSEKIEEAGTWLSELDIGEIVIEDGSEPADDVGGTPPAALEGSALPFAIVALYNAAFRMVHEGFDEQRAKDLADAVAGATPYVVG